MKEKISKLWPALALTALLIGLSGCGSNVSAQPPGGPESRPDRLKIEIDDSGDPTQKRPVLTLTGSSLVQQLYTTTFALPQKPEHQVCTMEMGPRYTLTFLQGEKTLATVNAERYGCRVVTIAGEQQQRQANQDFWSQLDLAIYQATPPAEVAWLAIQHTPQANRPPATARVASATTTQNLYDAILALPLVPRDKICSPEAFPEYQLVFHKPDQAIASVVSKQCNTISLAGHYQSRGGVYSMNEQFKQLFAQIIAGASFAPAQPDQLTLQQQEANGTVSQQLMTDANLRQQLYTKIFSLPAGSPRPDCPSSADKIAGKGRWYTLSFTQWDLPLLRLQAYEGSCTQLSLSSMFGGNLILQDDREFWDLLHRAARV